jgi:hypothetical protein
VNMAIAREATILCDTVMVETWHTFVEIHRSHGTKSGPSHKLWHSTDNDQSV